MRRFIITACEDLSWVAPDLGRRLSRVADIGFRVISQIREIGRDIEDSKAASVAQGYLLELEDALLLHDPERLESLRRAREQIAAWDAREASKADGREAVPGKSGASTTPVRESAADGALGDQSASPATSAPYEPGEHRLVYADDYNFGNIDWTA
jgi:hypothetical protein